jgi:hypothetical protein
VIIPASPARGRGNRCEEISRTCLRCMRGPTTSRPTPPAWTSKKGSLMPMAPVPAITLTPVGYFPEKYCLENLAHLRSPHHPASPRPSRRCSSSACPTATAPIGTVTRQTGTLAKPTATAPIGMVTGCTGYGDVMTASLGRTGLAPATPLVVPGPQRNL